MSKNDIDYLNANPNSLLSNTYTNFDTSISFPTMPGGLYKIKPNNFKIRTNK